MSSAYIKSLCSLAPPITPLIPESALIAAAKGSKNGVKRRGERTARWVLLVMLKKEESIPFVRAAVLVLEYNTVTYLINLWPKPNFSRVYVKKPLST
jgi:hypothetical protein